MRCGGERELIISILLRVTEPIIQLLDAPCNFSAGGGDAALRDLVAEVR